MIITALLIAIFLTVAVVVAAVAVRKQKRDIHGEVKETVNALKETEPRRSSTVGPPTIGGTRIFSAVEQPTIRFNCKTCGQHFDAPEGMAGEAITCPACSTSMIVPDTSEEEDRQEEETT